MTTKTQATGGKRTPQAKQVVNADVRRISGGGGKIGGLGKGGALDKKKKHYRKKTET